MASVDISGVSVSTSTASAELDVVDESCLQALQALLPPGSAWSLEADAELTKLLRALSYEFSRVRRRGRLLLEELDPRTTTELLAELETVYGITTDASQPLASRRGLLHAKMLGYGDPTPASFVAIAASLGYTATITEYRHTDMLTCTSACIALFYDRAWMYVWDVTAPSNGATADAQLQATLESLAPLHTLVRCIFI